MNISDTLAAALPVHFEGVLRRSAEHLLAHVLGKPREWVIAHPEAEITPEQSERFNALAEQYADGVPIAYLTGEKQFFEYTFTVTPDVLVPRPETEQVVELALQCPQSQIPDLKILDVGTGAGIIAITLALKLPQAHVTATDISSAALAVARANAERHRVADRITFIETNLLSGLSPQSFDLICANIPYIPSADLETLDVAKHEPLIALDGGADGLGVIRRFFSDAPKVLRSPDPESGRPGGCILLEIEYRQGSAVAAIARDHFPGAQVVVHKDLGGLERVVEINT